MNSSLFERLRRIAADVLEVTPRQITESVLSETMETWDSVHHLNLVLALEQEFHLQFEPEEIDDMTSIPSVLVVLDRKLQPPSK